MPLSKQLRERKAVCKLNNTGHIPCMTTRVKASSHCLCKLFRTHWVLILASQGKNNVSPSWICPGVWRIKDVAHIDWTLLLWLIVCYTSVVHPIWDAGKVGCSKYVMFEVLFRNNPQNCQDKTSVTQWTPGVEVIVNEHTHQRIKTI